MIRQVILDTETTGLSPESGDRIIEIGCVELINRRPSGKVFHQYINPLREVSYGAFQVHGISTEFLQDKPLFGSIANALKNFLIDAELIIHNAPFDIRFLQHEFRLLNDPWQEIENYCSVVDTLQLARSRHPGQKNNLDALCKRYNIDNAHRTKHGALLDAEILAELYLIMTGGQTDLQFEPVKSDSEFSEKKVSISNVFSLPVIYANPEELKAHQLILEKMKNSNKKCAWTELEAEIA